MLWERISRRAGVGNGEGPQKMTFCVSKVQVLSLGYKLTTRKSSLKIVKNSSMILRADPRRVNTQGYRRALNPQKESEPLCASFPPTMSFQWESEAMLPTEVNRESPRRKRTLMPRWSGHAEAAAPVSSRGWHT